MELKEIRDGLFKDENDIIMKSDNFWKFPKNVLAQFQRLDKHIHEVVDSKEEILHYKGDEYQGIHMVNKCRIDAHYQKHLIDYIKEQGEARFFFVCWDGFLLAEVDDSFYAVAPFIPEEE